jgi:5,10-methylenetetrahydrofolate reductase
VPFELMCEIEPATRPDLGRVRDQIEVLAPIATSFLVPDNHLGRATVSSIVVAHQINALGRPAVVCLNSRDRNLLGFRRDLLTAATLGVRDFLFVHGDRPESGRRSDDVNVRAMIELARTFDAEFGAADHPIRIGVAATASATALPPWKRAADFILLQVTFDAADAMAWHERIDFDGPVYAGVMVVASAQMGRKLTADFPQIAIPPELIDRLGHDRDAGVDTAVALVEELREVSGFHGVHLVPVGRYRDVAARLSS